HRPAIGNNVAAFDIPCGMTDVPPRRKQQLSDASTVHYVIVIGAGFGGIGMAIRLKQSGYDDFIVLERAPDIGGVWYANHYPGAACDVESHLYCYSFETG